MQVERVGDFEIGRIAPHEARAQAHGLDGAGLVGHVAGALEGALDRLHTFVNKFIRVTCEPHGITISRDKPLHSVFGEYVKALRESGHLESVMTDRILRSSISVLEAFNDVRNNKSLAHDNPILNYDESLLVFNHVASSIRFIKSLEARIKPTLQQAAEPAWDDSIPF